MQPSLTATSLWRYNSLELHTHEHLLQAHNQSAPPRPRSAVPRGGLVVRTPPPSSSCIRPAPHVLSCQIPDRFLHPHLHSRYPYPTRPVARRRPHFPPSMAERSNPIRTLSPYSRKRSSPTASSSIPPSRSEAPADPILRSDNRFEKPLPNRTLGRPCLTGQMQSQIPHQPFIVSAHLSCPAPR